MKHHEAVDQIDELIPPPRPWWVRLLVGTVIVGVAGCGSLLWGYGFVYPQPDCCGSGNGGAMMSLTLDRHAVTITAFFYNSSGRDLKITTAAADLPGARVDNIAVVDEFGSPLPVQPTLPLPTVVRGETFARLLITFVPTSCVDIGRRWGTVTLGLEVADSPLPSIARHYTMPTAVVGSSPEDFAVFDANRPSETTWPTTPLAAACALVGIG